MSLARYRSKRDFDITPEPPSATHRSGKTLSYFIQRHHARALHYDFRLEVDGVLKSWAVPKGPSLDPRDKRLAVHVEDHPYSYGSFEGTIPARQYGAGEVVLWDRGEWLPLNDPQTGLKKGRLEFELRGEKLQGRWIMVRIGKADEAQENWLLIKENDEEARIGKDANVTSLRPESVAHSPSTHGPRKISNSIEIAKQHEGQDQSKARSKPRKKSRDDNRMPASIDAQLATLSVQPPSGEEWLSEMKFDGYRGLCRVDNGKAHILTRTHLDWSRRWPQLVKALAALKVEQAWIDGEVVAVLPDGTISFEALQDQKQGDKADLALYAFDLLWVNGQDLRHTSLIERKRLLRALIPGVDESGLIRYSEHIAGDAAEVYRHACLHGMEGTVVKRADAAYSGRRDRSWLKLKCAQRQEFVIAGYTNPTRSRIGFGALLMGVYDAGGKNLHYAGRVGTGYDDRQLTQLLKRFKALECDNPAFVDPPLGRLAQSVHWLTPELVAEVKFAQWTKSGILRQGTFVALREDKRAVDIVRETAVLSTTKTPSKSSALSKKQNSKTAPGNHTTIVEGTRLTHPDKLLFNSPDLSKSDLARYYVAVADWILPQVQGRPMTMVRCPDGSKGKCFFQRHLSHGIPPAIEKIGVPEGDGYTDYMMVNATDALVATVQMGVLELHTWGSHKGKLLKPDRVVFDLDPAPDVPWRKVVEGAGLIHGLLDEIGLVSFVKTSGGKGLHIVIPIVPEHDWDTVKAWARGVAEHLSAVLPDYFTAKMAKVARNGKIFIDYLRNAAGATTVAAYSPRAKLGAPVSTPVAWSELTAKLRPNAFTVATILQRLTSLKRDPWQDYAKTKQHLSKRRLRLFTYETTE